MIRIMRAHLSRERPGADSEDSGGQRSRLPGMKVVMVVLAVLLAGGARNGHETRAAVGMAQALNPEEGA